MLNMDIELQWCRRRHSYPIVGKPQHGDVDWSMAAFSKGTEPVGVRWLVSDTEPSMSASLLLLLLLLPLPTVTTTVTATTTTEVCLDPADVRSRVHLHCCYYY